MDERDVIKAVLDGNTRRYAEIVAEYQQIVANLCYKYSGNRLDTEEITQQVFIELYTALPRFRFDSKLSTFIYRIAVNVICKAMAREGNTPHTLDDQTDHPSKDRNVEQQLIYTEQQLELRSAIAKLKHEQRTALVLFTFNDFSYNDIAQVMQCSLAKVETLIFRAKKNLTAIMTKKKTKAENKDNQ